MKGMLTKGLFSQQFRWMIKYRLRLNLVEDAQISMNDYRFTLSGSDVDITESIMLNQSIDEAIKAAEQRLAEMETEDRRDISKLDIYKKDDDEEAPAAAPAAKPGPRNALSDFKPAKPKAEPKPPVKKAEPEVPKAPKEPAAPKPEKQPDPSIEVLPLALDVARAYKAAKEPATTQPEPVAEETKAAVASLITNVVAAKKRPSKKEVASATPETVSETPDSTPTPKPKPKPRPKSKKPPVEPIPPKSTEDPS